MVTGKGIQTSTQLFLSKIFHTDNRENLHTTHLGPHVVEIQIEKLNHGVNSNILEESGELMIGAVAGGNVGHICNDTVCVHRAQGGYMDM